MKNNSLFKLASVSLGAIIILWIIQAVIIGAGNGFGATFGGNIGVHHNGGGVYMGNGFYYGGTTTYFLLILIKILFALFILGLVGGLIIWVKNNIFTVEEREAIKSTFTVKQVKREICSECNKELNGDWKVCPYCGKEKVITTTSK